MAKLLAANKKRESEKLRASITSLSSSKEKIDPKAQQSDNETSTESV